MRHLRAWNDPRGITPVGQEACADDGRNPRRTLGQSVPLHRLHADFRSGGRCGTPPDNTMRSDPQDYQLIATGTLHEVVSLLAKEPGAWLPIAGGTDVMVLYAAGKLPARKLVNIRSEEHTSELQSPVHLVCRHLLEKKKDINHVS